MAVHDLNHCACAGEGWSRCWPLTDADIAKRVERAERKSFQDDLSALKWRHARPGSPTLASILKDKYIACDFRGTYQQRLDLDGCRWYELRREAIFGKAARSRAQIGRAMGLKDGGGLYDLMYAKSPYFKLLSAKGGK